MRMQLYIIYLILEAQNIFIEWLSRNLYKPDNLFCPENTICMKIDKDHNLYLPS